MKKKRNPQFTTDEAQTATLLVTEGWGVCLREYKYKYPRVIIGMCDKEALKPAERVFKTKIIASRKTKTVCPPHLFPSDGKGTWIITKTGKPAEQLVKHLKPLLTKEFSKKWEQVLKECR